MLTHYVAELQSSVVTIRVSKTEGLWNRPNRRLHVQLLLGGGAMVRLTLGNIFLRMCSILRFNNGSPFDQLDTWGTDGEALQIIMPSEKQVSELVATSMKQYKTRLGNKTVSRIFIAY